MGQKVKSLRKFPFEAKKGKKTLSLFFPVKAGQLFFPHYRMVSSWPSPTVPLLVAWYMVRIGSPCRVYCFEGRVAYFKKAAAFAQLSKN